MFRRTVIPWSSGLSSPRKWTLAQKVKAVRTFEAPVTIYQSTRRNNAGSLKHQATPLWEPEMSWSTICRYRSSLLVPQTGYQFRSFLSGLLLACLTHILLTWTKWRAPTNASKWRMGFNSAFKGLMPFLRLYKLCRVKSGLITDGYVWYGAEWIFHNQFQVIILTVT